MFFLSFFLVLHGLVPLDVHVYVYVAVLVLKTVVMFCVANIFVGSPARGLSLQPQPVTMGSLRNKVI
jgi:hypothetical protein